MSNREMVEDKGKKFVELHNENGRKARIILFDDETVAVLATDKDGKPFYSESSPSPDVFYIAQHFFIEQGFKITNIEEEGKKIGKE